ncbi:MAG: hypothetical protein HYX63_09110 [Gammaproteobacteria bacterium]|nr:hypothetical protein [Gammaproteobacteria bacterium]
MTQSQPATFPDVRYLVGAEAWRGHAYWRFYLALQPSAVTLTPDEITGRRQKGRL